MKRFKATVVDRNGKKQVICEDAISRPLFEDSLLKRDLFIVTVKEFSDKKKYFHFSSRKIKKSFLLDFTYNLSSLLNFGLDINESLRILEDIYPQDERNIFIKELINSLKKGGKLSESIRKSQLSYLFDDFFIIIVASGEQSGNLKDAFLLIYEYIKNMKKLREKIISASIYPIFLLVMCFLLFNLFLFFIIPNFMIVYDSINFTPPFYIQFFFNLSNLVRNNFLIYFFFINLIIIGGYVFSKTKIFSNILTFFYNKMPIISNIYKLQNKIRISFCLELLLKGGINIEEVLKKLIEIELHSDLKKDYIKTINSLKEGERIKIAFRNIRLYDLKDLNIIEISDSTSKTSEGFNKIHIDSSSKLESYLDLIFKMIEPAMIIFIALFVFLIVSIVISPTIEMMKIIE